MGALLDSVSAQNYDDYEVIVCDDYSSIDYRDVIDRFRGRGELRYYRNPANLGMVPNWNESLRHASGDLAIVLGHDDVLLPGMFSAYVEAFRESDDVLLVSSGSRFIDADGRPSDFRTNVNHRAHIFVDRARYLLDGREVTRLCLRNGSALGELSVHMYRPADCRAVGGYDPCLRHAADLDLAVRIAQRGLTVYLNEPYLMRRMHTDNLTWRHLALGHVTADRERLFERNCGKYQFSSSEIRQFRAYLVACACYDILRLPKHRSMRAALGALRQIRRHASLWPSMYGSTLSELLLSRNLDRC